MDQPENGSQPGVVERIKGPRRFFYNFSSIGHALLDSLVLTFHLKFLLPPAENIKAGMIPFIPEKFAGFIPVIGFIMVIGRIVDAISDPLVASFSDRSKLKFGRRRIFLLIGALPLGISTMLIYFPPVQATSYINVIYLSFVVSFFFLFYTIYVAPYIALIPELGHDEKDRLSLTTSQAYFALIGGILATIAGPKLLDVFQDYGPVRSYQIMISILSVVGIICLYTAVFSVNEKRFSNAKPSTVPLKESLIMTLKSKPFIIFLISNMCFWYVFNVIRSSVLHIGETLMGISDTEADGNFVFLFAVAIIFFFVVWKIASRFGKKPVMLIGLGAFALICGLMALIGIVPVAPAVYGKVMFALLGIPVAILLVIPNVFISEICDYDFRKTGERREGMFFGVHGLFIKINLGLSSAFTSFFFVVFGKDIANPLGVRLAILFGGIVALVGLFVFLKYPEKVVKESSL